MDWGEGLRGGAGHWVTPGVEPPLHCSTYRPLAKGPWWWQLQCGVSPDVADTNQLWVGTHPCPGIHFHSTPTLTPWSLTYLFIFIYLFQSDTHRNNCPPLIHSPNSHNSQTKPGARNASQVAPKGGKGQGRHLLPPRVCLSRQNSTGIRDAMRLPSPQWYPPQNALL